MCSTTLHSTVATTEVATICDEEIDKFSLHSTVVTTEED